MEQLERYNLNWILFEDWKVSFYMLPIRYEDSDFCNARPFNWYESPYPDIEKIHRDEQRIFDNKKTVLEIELNDERQIELLEKFKELAPYEWGSEKGDIQKNHYYYNNSMFGKESADCLQCMMRVIKPKKIIEIGSGFSTAVMLDINNDYFDGNIEISCIEPNANRLKSLIKESDHICINETELQNIELEFFDELEPGDFLFIDSSHVARIDSDVNYYIFEIFPKEAEKIHI